MLENERVLTLTQATKILPTFSGKRVAVSTVWRWARKGVNGVHLEVRRIGARFVTSVEALDRFTATLASLPPTARPTRSCTKQTRTESQRRRAQEQAKRELQAAGLLESQEPAI